MTFRTWLGREIRALIAEPEIPTAPPTPSPGPTPSSPTLNGRTTPATSAEEPVTALSIAKMMSEMQRETMKEMRGMVLDILQGREQSAASEAAVSVSQTRFDPPDYDAEGTDDLPGGIRGIFAREEMEAAEFRTSHSEPELLRSQLERARAAAGMDPQGPSDAPSFSTESIGLRPEDLGFP